MEIRKYDGGQIVPPSPPQKSTLKKPSLIKVNDEKIKVQELQ